MKRTAARVLVGALTALAVAPALASAAPAPLPSGQSIYSPPSATPPGVHGDLIWYESKPASILGANGTVRLWRVLYHTQTAKGQPTWATGTVLVPPTRAAGNPVVSYAFGTQGLGAQCAPSRQAVGASVTLGYESGNVGNALNRGFTVVATDYEGFTEGPNGNAPQPFVAGLSEGRAVLDIIRAASQIPNAGVSATAKTAIWGYSQGGGAAAWAGQLKSSYAPSVNLVGTAAGGVPADLNAVARNLNQNIGAAFLGYAAVGLNDAYPELGLEGLANAQGLSLIAALKKQCTFESLPQYAFLNIQDYTKNNLTLNQLLALPAWASVLAQNKLGGVTQPAPMYLYHGIADEIIPWAQALTYRNSVCSRGTRVQSQFGLVGEHLSVEFTGADGALSWIGDRFAGRTAPSNCFAPF